MSVELIQQLTLQLQEEIQNQQLATEAGLDLDLTTINEIGLKLISIAAEDNSLIPIIMNSLQIPLGGQELGGWEMLFNSLHKIREVSNPYKFWKSLLGNHSPYIYAILELLSPNQARSLLGDENINIPRNIDK